MSKRREPKHLLFLSKDIPNFSMSIIIIWHHKTFLQERATWLEGIIGSSYTFWLQLDGSGMGEHLGCFFAE